MGDSHHAGRRPDCSCHDPRSVAGTSCVDQCVDHDEVCDHDRMQCVDHDEASLRACNVWIMMKCVIMIACNVWIMMKRHCAHAMCES
jgi:hypothetical protein